MVRLWLTFIFFAVAIGFATQTVRKMTGKERWDLTKIIAFSIMCSLGAIVLMMLIVVLF